MRTPGGSNLPVSRFGCWALLCVIVSCDGRRAVRIACVGDSITAGAHSSDRATMSYPAQLQRFLGPGYAVTNLGSGGSTLQPTPSAYSRRYPYKALVRKRWDIVVIMFGTNDAKSRDAGGPQYWKDDCGDPPFDLERCSFARAYASLLKVVRRLGPSRHKPPEIILGIPAPLMRSGGCDANQTAVNTVLPLLIPAIAQANSLPLEPVSVFAALGGTPDWQAQFPVKCSYPDSTWPGCAFYCDSQSCDNCHPNDAGYTALAHEVKRAIKQRHVIALASDSSSAHAATGSPAQTASLGQSSDDVPFLHTASGSASLTAAQSSTRSISAQAIAVLSATRTRERQVNSSATPRPSSEGSATPVAQSGETSVTSSSTTVESSSLCATRSSNASPTLALSLPSRSNATRSTSSRPSSSTASRSASASCSPSATLYDSLRVSSASATPNASTIA